jgi:hypothetical protein
MFGLKHITDEELRRYYYLEGHISGNVKNINMLNGIQQDYVGSKINNFITWHDDFGKPKFELYVKENLPKMEIEYENIVKENQMREKERDEIELKKKQIIWNLAQRPLNHDTKKLVLNKFNKFNISELEYETESKKCIEQLTYKFSEKFKRPKEIRVNKIYNYLQNKIA